MTEQLRIELDGAGYGIDQVVFVGINDKTAAANQQALVDKCTFPLLQDTVEVDAWGLHGGAKDDFALYDANGDLIQWLPYGGPVNLNLSDPVAYEGFKALVLAALGAP